MTALAPARYALEANQTAFPFDDVAVAVGYEIEPPRMFSSERRAAVTITLANSGGVDEKAHCDYAVPKDGRIGAGLPHVESELYRIADESVRAFAQLRSLDRARQAVAHLEEALGDDPAGPAPDGDAAHPLDGFEVALIKSLVYVTNVTSISHEGLTAYRAGGKALAKATPSSPVPTRAASFARHLDLTPDADLRAAQRTTLDHVLATEPGLGADHAAYLVDHFVPRYLQLRRESRLPASLWDHAFSSLWQGGLTGWITLSVIGEAVAKNVLGFAVDIPGFWIGTATALLWPYLRFPFMRSRDHAELRELFAEADRKLAAPTATQTTLPELAARRRALWAADDLESDDDG